MGKIIALAACKYSATSTTPDRIYLQHRWMRSLLAASQLQLTKPSDGAFCALLERPCRTICTEDGELALAFGSPPLVVRSGDVQLLPIVRRDIQKLRWMRSLPLRESARVRLAHMHRAAWLLVDALERLRAGLPEFDGHVTRDRVLEVAS